MHQSQDYAPLPPSRAVEWKVRHLTLKLVLYMGNLTAHHMHVQKCEHLTRKSPFKPPSFRWGEGWDLIEQHAL